MARTKEFDPDTALSAALDLFWKQGYEATSVDDLVRALGVNRASLYATFGGKRELFERALTRYSAEVESVLLESLQREKSALRGIERFFEAVTGHVDDGKRRGCLVTLTALELSGRDAKARKQVERFFHAIEEGLHAALVRAKAAGELKKDAKPRELARFLLASVEGLIVLSKAYPDRAVLRDVSRATLSALR